MTQRPIVVIAGSTAAGKTGAALALAERLGGEIVGADSVQVYRGFDIGSAKPRAEELGAVRHHMVDILDPDEPIDAGAYARRADAVIAEVHGRGRLPIVVGGTGLWLRALARGLAPLPAPDPTLRAALEAEAHALGAPAMHARLARVDPQVAAGVHPNDRVRIVRALEVHAQTGVPLGELQARHALGAPRYPGPFVVLDLPKGVLAERIAARTRAMIEAGFADEVRSLRARWGDSVRAFGSVGYRQMLEHVRDGVPLDETVQRIDRATRLYARRQRTWFRAEPGITWRTTAADLLAAGSLERLLAT